MTETTLAEPGANTPSYEQESKRRLEIWDTALRGQVELRDPGALQGLKAAIDAQSALAELRIKTRQADWAKTMTWAPLIFPTLGAILGAFIGGLLKR